MVSIPKAFIIVIIIIIIIVIVVVVVVVVVIIHANSDTARLRLPTITSLIQLFNMKPNLQGLNMV